MSTSSSLLRCCVCLLLLLSPLMFVQGKKKKNHCTSDYLTPKWNGAGSSHGVARQPWQSGEQGQINSSRSMSCSRANPTPASVCKPHILWAENYAIRRGIRQTAYEVVLKVFSIFFPFQRFQAGTSRYPGSLLLSPVEQRHKGLLFYYRTLQKKTSAWEFQKLQSSSGYSFYKDHHTCN